MPKTREESWARSRNRTGTGGFRLLCHQFYTSSLHLLGHYISRCNNCSLTTMYMTSTLRLLANGDQGQNIRTIVYPLNTSHQ